jgi:RNA polymerase sigma-70 factor (ECF subfamily)
MTLEPLNNESISALIRRIDGGDSSALMTLYDGTSPLVFGLVLKIVGEIPSAEETLLDVYTHVWKQSASRDQGVSPLQWLLIIARDNALARLDWSKRDKSKREAVRPASDSLLTVAPEQQKLARSRLASIAFTEREVVEWAYYSGLSCTEIAAQIGKPLGAVKTHIRMGLSKLTESFSQSSGRDINAGMATGGQIEA